MKKKFILIYLFAGLMIFAFAPGNIAATNTIKWFSYDDAKALGEKNTNKVFLYFFSTNCYYCGLMEKNTFSNPSVVNYINQNFIPIRVDSNKETTLSKNYNIRGNPTNYFLDEKFEIIGNLPGYHPPKDLLNVLKYVHTDSFKQMSLGDFLKKQ